MKKAEPWPGTHELQRRADRYHAIRFALLFVGLMVLAYGVAVTLAQY